MDDFFNHVQSKTLHSQDINIVIEKQALEWRAKVIS